MEELHEISAAYYNNATSEVQQLAWQFFRSMDKDNDGQVNFLDFFQFFRQRGYKHIGHDVFAALDANGDGSLEFKEVLTLYYIMKTRNLICDGCRKMLLGVYFTCLTCFHSGADSCDLCATCYKERRFRHPHTSFLDSHMLLRSKKWVPASPAVKKPQFQQPAMQDYFPRPHKQQYDPQSVLQQFQKLAMQDYAPQSNGLQYDPQSVPQQFQGLVASNASSSSIDWGKAFNALDMAVNLGSSGSCSIM
ncbi:hypothetical protein CJ030_MR3G001204 [Morella rubra]|uniref:EF-hand domain-containing protein n=1 Tax=Morella rubra TaxID=262757 RepID=A0A6A1W344_9ROSI|nr:hypothetical protein CJ030_MR3G001204 [Morella rubra]